MSFSSLRTGQDAEPDAATAGLGALAISDQDLERVAQARRRKRRLLVWGSRLLTAVVLIGGWQLLTAIKVIDPFFWGQPSGVVTQLKTWVDQGTEFGSLWSNIWVTMKEAILGFIYGVIAGVVLGILLGQSRLLSDVLGPYIKIANAMPRIVLGALFVVALGFGTTSKVVLAAVLVFFGVFFNAYQGVREVDRNLLANARVLGANRLQVIRHVTVPSAMTWIIASLHVAFGFAIIGAIVGELLGSTHGIGLLIQTSMSSFRANGVFAGMVIISVLALTAEALIGALERRVLGWRPPSQASASQL